MHKILGKHCLISQEYYDEYKPRQFNYKGLLLNSDLISAFLFHSKEIRLNNVECNTLLSVLDYYVNNIAEKNVLINIIITYMQSDHVKINYLESTYYDAGEVKIETMFEFQFESDVLCIIIDSKEDCSELLSELLETSY